MKLVLVCDYGLDDAAATVDALAHAAQDGHKEVSLVAIGGNVPPDVALANAKKLVAHLPFETVPVTVVDTTQAAPEQLDRINLRDYSQVLFAWSVDHYVTADQLSLLDSLGAAQEA